MSIFILNPSPLPPQKTPKNQQQQKTTKKTPKKQNKTVTEFDIFSKKKTITGYTA